MIRHYLSQRVDALDVVRLALAGGAGALVAGATGGGLVAFTAGALGLLVLLCAPAGEPAGGLARADDDDGRRRYNPANGLPMVTRGLDIEGNARGTRRD